ncbi:DUF7793 family protein [Arthrobacter sp. H-02-3]|uniref:DUF7793 family protein n=1 Tax=Arthrobacter sp. H-02-3 TaxID=2703675 RepID=UPI000DD29BE2|nr:hypothetical protein [Arthrobacter sp. H-02-3]PVZ56307.1 hypothetical protein C9424_11315 [Arthrobacter sp. H-02-3]
MTLEALAGHGERLPDDETGAAQGAAVMAEAAVPSEVAVTAGSPAADSEAAAMPETTATLETAAALTAAAAMATAATLAAPPASEVPASEVPATDGPSADAGAARDPAGDAARAIGVRMIDGAIIEVLLPPNQEIEGPEARIAGEAVRALAAGRRMPVLLVITGVVGVSVEARQVYTGSIAATAFALVGESPVDRVIAHYLLRSRSETIPAQFFSSESAAVEWLRQYVRDE